MSNWLGSHWRWRVVMLVVAGALLGYGWWQAERWTARHLVNYRALPVVYRKVQRDGSQLLEAFDWKTGRRWALARIDPETYPGEIEWSVRVSRDGKSVVWRAGSQVHAVDIQSPASRRSYPLPITDPRHKLIGLSHDARFAIFEAVGLKTTLPNGQTNVELLGGWTGKQPAVFILSVVDLKSGQIVSSREWESSLAETNTIGMDEFKSYLQAASPVDPAEPVWGRWKLTGEGEWELLEQSQQFPVQYIEVMREATGEWRVVENVSEVPADAVAVQTYVMDTFDSGKRFVANGMGKARTFIGNFETKEAFELGFGDDTTGWFVAGDGAYAVVGDRRDDIRVFDLKTGKVIARDASGSSRRNHLLGVGIGLLVLAVTWAWLAIVESKLSWGLIDALAAILVVEAAVFPIYASFHDPLLQTSLPIDLFEVIPSVLLRGAFVGGAIVTGWYWAHGREWFAVRWLLGTLWLIALAIPLVVYDRSATVYYDLAMVLRAWVIAGLVTSGLTAAFAVLFRPLSWRVHAMDESRSPWRFGLSQLLMLTASVGIALVLVQSMLELPGLFSLLRISSWPSGSFFLGVALVGVLFLRSPWAIGLGTLVLFAMALAATYWYVEAVAASSFLKKPDRYVGEAIAAASTALAILLPCLILRKHGWRWTRLLPAESLTETPA